MSYPTPLPERDGKLVSFAPPRAVEEGTSRIGRVKESVRSGPHKDKEWGYYLYFSELIEWNDEQMSKSIRLAYYYAPFGATCWLWGGQYSIEDSPEIIKELLEKTLQRKGWFEK